jgi:transposase
MTAELLWQIHSLKKAGSSCRCIQEKTGIDRKTVAQYMAKIGQLELGDTMDYMAILARLATLLPDNHKPRPAFSVLEPYRDEIGKYISGDKEAGKDPLKPKTAWEVIRRKYELDAKTSYETFKRFVRETITLTVPRRTFHFEHEPGDEVQLDYGKVGMRTEGRKRRAVQAFCAMLPSSHRPFVRFGYSQDALSFSQATADMFTWFGGTTRRINLDNLKAGVLSPDIYNPVLNRTFAELCEHYGVQADPAKVRTPKDKPHVERFVPSARELYRMLDALYPQASLEELNAHALSWCENEYANKPHWLSGQTPMEIFDQFEREALGPLPDEPFVPARWTRGKVQNDQFVRVVGIHYGMPAMYIGKNVEIRTRPDLVTIYHAFSVVRQYPVTGKKLNYLASDFPDWAQPDQKNSREKQLANQSVALGPQTEAFVSHILKPGGNLAMRRARGIIALCEKNRELPGYEHVIGKAVREGVCTPDRLEVLFAAEKNQNILPFPISETGWAMGRDALYYVDCEHSEERS